MNTENLITLRNHLQTSTTYDQREWFHDCGTPACVAGHAAALALGANNFYDWSAKEEDHLTLVQRIQIEAEDWLELEEREADVMFDSHPYYKFPLVTGEPIPRKATKEDAIRMLNWAIDNDEVKWDE